MSNWISTMTPLFTIGIVLLIIILLVMLMYNGLVRKKMYVTEAWASIDVQLKRKANVLPNLVDTIKMQTAYEGDLLLKITDARSGMMQGSHAQRMQTNETVSKMLPSIHAVMENYPQLGANESFRKMMSEIADAEDKIAYARNRYNISVTTYNTALRVFPSSLIAGLFGFTPEQVFEMNDAARVEADNMRIKDIS